MAAEVQRAVLDGDRKPHAETAAHDLQEFALDVHAFARAYLDRRAALEVVGAQPFDAAVSGFAHLHIHRHVLTDARRQRRADQPAELGEHAADGRSAHRHDAGIADWTLRMDAVFETGAHLGRELEPSRAAHQSAEVDGARPADAGIGLAVKDIERGVGERHANVSKFSAVPRGACVSGRRTR